MKPQWPTLEGRLANAPTSRLEALNQMKANGDVLTPLAERVLLKERTKANAEAREILNQCNLCHKPD